MTRCGACVDKTLTWIGLHKRLTFFAVLSFALFISTIALAATNTRLRRELNASRAAATTTEKNDDISSTSTTLSTTTEHDDGTTTPNGPTEKSSEISDPEAETSSEVTDTTTTTVIPPSDEPGGFRVNQQLINRILRLKGILSEE